jgi:hypothetical protein
MGEDRPVIRKVVVHIANEQPLLADLYGLPQSSDAGLLCTNLRAMDGKRPVFIDRIEDTFFFPYRAIRFLEIPTEALERHQAEVGSDVPGVHVAAPDSVDDDVPETSLPVIAIGAGVDADAGEEIDEDFLKRIRDI